MTASVHIHALQPAKVEASSDFDCRARARDGRLCRGRRALYRFTPWYGREITCYHCGAMWQDGWLVQGRADVGSIRDLWHSAVKETAQGDGES